MNKAKEFSNQPSGDEHTEKTPGLSHEQNDRSAVTWAKIEPGKFMLAKFASYGRERFFKYLCSIQKKTMMMEKCSCKVLQSTMMLQTNSL